MQQEFKKVILPELKYGYNALEPVLSGEILEVHHKKHHNGYVNKYNAAIESMIKKHYEGDIPAVQVLCKKVSFVGGGHNCHSWYWDNLAPSDNGGGNIPNEKSPLTKAIVKDFGNYENLIKNFNSKTGAIQGSGWGWLALNPVTKNLSIEETLNQDMIETNGLVPLLTVDVWEHAYYLQYKNLRPDYLKNIWKVVNWRCVEDRYNKATL